MWNTDTVAAREKVWVGEKFSAPHLILYMQVPFLLQKWYAHSTKVAL